MGRKAYRVLQRQPGRRNISQYSETRLFLLPANLVCCFYEGSKNEGIVIVNFFADSPNWTLNANREVIEETIKQSDTRLKKVNHPKGWGAKPLV